MTETERLVLYAIELQVRATLLVRDLKSGDREAMRESLYTNLAKMYDILGDIYKGLPNDR